MNYNWNWSIFWQEAADGSGTYMDLLLRGLSMTLSTAVVACLIALAFGFAVGIARTLPGRAAGWLSGLWVEYFRNIPLLVHLFLFFFVLPELLPAAMGTWLKQLPNGPFVTAAIGIGLYMSARVAVGVEAGIRSLPRGQAAAATAIGLTRWQSYRYILLPIACRIMLPSLTNDMINTIKNTSVALTIGLIELTAAARQMQELSYQVFEALIAATLVYLLLNLLATWLATIVERRLRIKGSR